MGHFVVMPTFHPAAALRNPAWQELLAAHLPMILLGKSYGQEKANTTMLTGMGASMHVTTARELIVI